LPRNPAKRAGGKPIRLARIYFSSSHHFTNLDDDLGKEEPTILLCCYPGPYRNSKRIYEGEEIAFVGGDKRNLWPRGGSW
jgi:hypothetical protein